VIKPIYLSLLCCAICLGIIQTEVHAHTFGTVEVICPLDGTKFKTVVDFSGTSFGMRLDLKPIGPIAAPGRIPVCPTDHFVVYKDANEFTEAEKQHLIKYVNSKEYQELAVDNSTHFLLGKIFEYLEEEVLNIAHVYLKASWQVESTPEKYQKYANESLKKFKLFLSNSDKKDDTWQTSQLVAGELERRLKRFDDAKKRFSSLKKLPESKNGIIARIISYQLELIDKKDSAAYAIPYDE
jgi:hypothetical protein